MSKFVFSLGIIAFGLSLGYAVQDLDRRQMIRLPVNIDRLRKLILEVALIVFLPAPIIGSVWSMRIDDPRIATLPFLGVFALFLGGASALAISRKTGMGRPQTGSFFVCGSFTNLGAVGGLICYIFLGEPGFGLVPLYRLFEEFLYFLIGFPVARYYGFSEREEGTFLEKLKKTACDPLIAVTILSLLTGGILNQSGLERPECYRTVNAILIPLMTIVFLVPVGMVVKVHKIGNYLRECILISMIKFVIVPTAITTIAFLLGYHHSEEKLLMKVAVILSAMPVAFTSLVPPTLYDLDIDLANSCWLFTTGLLVIVLPLLYLVTCWV